MKTLVFATKLLPNALAQRPHALRELEVCADSSLYDLAGAIVEAFGFDFDHAFGFFSRAGADFLKSERKYELFALEATVVRWRRRPRLVSTPARVE